MSSHGLAGSHHTNHPGRAPFADDPRRACKNIDTGIFYPEGAAAAGLDAKAVCRGCVFRDACREWAIDWEEHGWWGGTSAAWRREERRRRRRATRAEAVAA